MAGTRSKTDLIEVEVLARRVGHVDVRELDRGEVDDETGLVEEGEGPGVVVDRGEVVHAADDGSLGELADGAVAVGPVVRVLGPGSGRPGEDGEQGRRRCERSLGHVLSPGQRGREMVGGMGRPFNWKKYPRVAPPGEAADPDLVFHLEPGIPVAKLVGSRKGNPCEWPTCRAPRVPSWSAWLFCCQVAPRPRPPGRPAVPQPPSPPSLPALDPGPARLGVRGQGGGPGREEGRGRRKVGSESEGRDGEAGPGGRCREEGRSDVEGRARRQRRRGASAGQRPGRRRRGTRRGRGRDGHGRRRGRSRRGEDARRAEGRPGRATADVDGRLRRDAPEGAEGPRGQAAQGPPAGAWRRSRRRGDGDGGVGRFRRGKGGIGREQGRPDAGGAPRRSRRRGGREEGPARRRGLEGRADRRHRQPAARPMPAGSRAALR